MRAIALLDLVLMILFAWGFSTQVLIPFIAGEKFFPFFRNRRKLENDLAEVKTNATDRKLRDEISEIRKGKV